jgi:hypothetical protein
MKSSDLSLRNYGPEWAEVIRKSINPQFRLLGECFIKSIAPAFFVSTVAASMAGRRRRSPRFPQRVHNPGRQNQGKFVFLATTFGKIADHLSLPSR